MASAAFKSSSRESAPIRPNDAGSSSKSGDRRRSRSLSRAPARGKFVNTARGSDFEEISLDGLADEFFSALELEDKVERGRERGRAGRRLSDASFLMETESSKRRSRSVSRKPALDRNPAGRRLSDASFLMETESSKRRGRSVSRKPNLGSNAGDRRGFDANSRRRSFSVARYQCSESESESDFSGSSISINKLLNSHDKNCRSLSSHNSSARNSLKRSESHHDFRYSQESHSIHSSALTDYEHLHVPIGSVFDQGKAVHPARDLENPGFYEVMRKEARNAFDEIKPIEKSKPSILSGDDDRSSSSDAIKAIAETRRNYAAKLEESERRKQELLAELAAEEQREQELSKLVKELLPETKEATPESHPQSRKRSKNRSRVSMHLFEDAEKYFEDFLSSVDDTDISSFDGERSDGGSIIAGRQKSNATPAGQPSPPLTNADGLVLPWLEWETSNDITPVSCKIKETSCLQNSVHSVSSQGSWSPGNTHENYSEIFKRRLVGEKPRSTVSSFFSMDEYSLLRRSEDFLAEVLSQRQRVISGGMLLCRGTLH